MGGGGRSAARRRPGLQRPREARAGCAPQMGLPGEVGLFLWGKRPPQVSVPGSISGQRLRSIVGRPRIFFETAIWPVGFGGKAMAWGSPAEARRPYFKTDGGEIHLHLRSPNVSDLIPPTVNYPITWGFSPWVSKWFSFYGFRDHPQWNPQ